MKGSKNIMVSLELILAEKKSCGITVALLMAMTFIGAGCAPQSSTLSFAAGNALSSPRFGFFIVNYPSSNPDSSKGDFYGRIAYDDLIFVKTNSGFMAHYQLSLNLYLDKGLTAGCYSKTFDRQIIAEKYSQTLSRTLYDTLKDKLVMKPGKYFAVLRFNDLNTSSSSSKEFEYTFKDFFRDSVDISNVALYDRPGTSGVPLETVAYKSEDVFADFYVTCKNPPASILLHLIAKSADAPTSLDTTYKLDQASTVQRYRLRVNIAVLAPAVYDLRISINGNGEERFAETAFRITGNYPIATGFSHEIGPLAYIMTGAEFDSLKGASVKERQEKLKTFWLAQSHGDTIVSKAMQQEFYKRVDTADGEFRTVLTPGWQSDRGKIYILYGNPDRIENHFSNFKAGPAANSSPYQVWYYDSLKLRFVFVDEFRSGDYTLTKTGGF
ncbi:MAG: GWxTD domain-containing protein [Candidatus Kryptoniota bacterium]